MPFEDYEKFEAEPIVLPIRGKKYALPPMTAKIGLWIRLAQEGKDTPLSKMTDVEQAELFLGPVYQQMVDDDVPEPAIARAVLVALTDWKVNRQTAEAVWEVGADPERLTAHLSQKNGQAVAADSTKSRSTGAANATPTAPSSTTTSRKAPRQTKRTPRAK